MSKINNYLPKVLQPIVEFQQINSDLDIELNNYNKQETKNIRKNDLTNSIDSIQTSFIVKNGLASIKQGDIKFNKLKSTLSKYHVSFPVCKKHFKINICASRCMHCNIWNIFSKWCFIRFFNFY